MDKGIRIDNAAPALPSATSPYPVLGRRLQPQPSVAPLLPQKIEKLEHRDLFFSSQSARSHVERYLAESRAHRLSVRFERPESGWLKRFLNHPQALMLVEKAPLRTPSSAAIQKTTPDLKGDKSPKKPTDPKATANTPERLNIRLMEFEPLTQTPVLQKALLAVSSEPFKIQRFAFAPQTGELYPEAAFAKQGITRQERPMFHRAMSWLREVMSYNPESRVSFGVDESLALRIGRRVRWNPSERWHDAAGHSLRMMDLMRLDSAQLAEVVHVQEQSELEKSASQSLGRADLRKTWRDKIMDHIDAIERRGYFLQPGHIRQTLHPAQKTAQPKRPVVTLRPKSMPKVGLAENPFASVNFSAIKLTPQPTLDTSVKAQGKPPRKPMIETTAIKPQAKPEKPSFKAARNPFKGKDLS